MADGSRMVSALQIGTLVTQIALAAGVMLYVGGSLNVERQINFVTNNTGGKTQSGTATGVTLQENGVTQIQIHNAPCTMGAGNTASGGLAKYPFCLVDSPLAVTGALENLSVECAGTDTALTGSGGFVKSSTAAVASALGGLSSFPIASGSLALSKVGSGTDIVTWNPADLIKVQVTRGTVNPNANCLLRYQVRQLNVGYTH